MARLPMFNDLVIDDLLLSVQCSQDQFEEARSSITKALELRPDLKKKMEDDGEFKRLCKRILKDFDIQ